MRQINEQIFKLSKNAVAFNSLLFLFSAHLFEGLAFPLKLRVVLLLLFHSSFVHISDCWLARFVFIFSISALLFLLLDTQNIHLIFQIHSYTQTILTTPVSSPPPSPRPSHLRQHNAASNLHTLFHFFHLSLLPFLPPTPHIEAVLVVAVLVALPPDTRSFNCPTFLCTALIKGNVRSCHPSYSCNTPRNSNKRSSC